LSLSHESIKLALASIGDVLLYENSGPESTDYSFADTDFRALTEEMIYDMSPQAKKRNIHLSLNADPVLPHINLDRKKIGAVIQNLIENAIKYSHENGAIEVKLSKTANTAVLAVKDNGIGIPEKEQGLIFNRFFRASNAEEQEEGMGIGLYIGKHIVDTHRGKLWFTSTANQGTTFYLELPLENQV
jgi:signal transduction histidine kinase